VINHPVTSFNNKAGHTNIVFVTDVISDIVMPIFRVTFFKMGVFKKKVDFLFLRTFIRLV